MVHAIERWADEQAAAEAGDRIVTARSLIRAALAVAAAAHPHPHAAYARSGRARAGRALLAPPPHGRWHRALPAAVSWRVSGPDSRPWRRYRARAPGVATTLNSKLVGVTAGPGTCRTLS